MTPQDLEQLRRLAQAVLDNEDTSSRDIARRSFGTPDVAVRVLALLRERDRTSEGDGMEGDVSRDEAMDEFRADLVRHFDIVFPKGQQARWPFTVEDLADSIVKGMPERGYVLTRSPSPDSVPEREV